MSVRAAVVAVLVAFGVMGVLGFCGGVALAVGPQAPVVDSEGASGVGPFGATLEAQVNPEEQETSCVRFEYGTSAAYGSSVPCANGSLGSSTEDQAASASVAGLRPSTEYHYRVVVENLSSPLGGTVGVGQTFTTPAVLGSEESSSEVTDKGAVLGAQVDAGGVLTTYYFQYGPSAAYGSRTAGETLSGSESVGVTTRLAGLAPNSEYHFRIVTESENGVNEVGADTVFRTLPAGMQGLPDGRVYEMVTSPENEGSEVYVPRAVGSVPRGLGIQTARLFQVSTNGEAVAYQASATPTGGGAESGGSGAGNQYLARRSSAGGWIKTVLQPPGDNTLLYLAFSRDLSVGILPSKLSASSGGWVVSSTTLKAEGGYNVLVSRALGGDVFRPLFTMTPPNRSAAQFEAGVWNGGVSSGILNHYAFAGGSADFSDLLFEDNDALIEGEGALEQELQADVKREIAEGEDGNYLYDSVDGRAGLVDVLPDGRVAPNATFGAPSTGERNPPDFDHVISSDGRRVFWTALTTGVVYVREDGSTTVPVSPGPARFWTATEDGRYAFYTEGDGLYRFDVEHPGARDVIAGAGAGVEGVVGTSENGEDVYFAASGELAAGAKAGLPNLYLVRNGGHAVFIATLSPEDGVSSAFTSDELRPYARLTNVETSFGDWVPVIGDRTAEVTSDGGSVVFMSDQSLPVQGLPQGYPNQGLDEVYVYDAQAGKLFCASCSPNGAPPVSEEGAAGFLQIGWLATYRPQSISRDGSRVFFDSMTPLVAQDTNGAQDVYEWEREGSGSCTAGTGADGGCIYLLSGGVSSSYSWLVGASASGDDVFIATRAQLTPEDDNETFDLYDARVGGVPPAPKVACSAGECPGTPGSAPGFATPSSVLYGGAGNLALSAPVKAAGKPGPRRLTRAQKLAAALRVCRRRPRRSRGVCEARARKSFGPVGRAKKSSRSAKQGGR
jgi:hypothetical protein